LARRYNARVREKPMRQHFFRIAVHELPAKNRMPGNIAR
jgi:hypothetical protein